MLVWRICKPEFTRLDGEGSKVNGGRWNSVGTPVIYTAGTRALAILETRVHTRRLPKHLVRMTIEIPDDPIKELDLSQTPNWSRDIEATRRIGDVHFTGVDRDIPLRVPSVVEPEEYNVLISPNYCLAEAKVISIDPVHFDERLWAGGNGE